MAEVAIKKQTETTGQPAPAKGRFLFALKPSENRNSRAFFFNAKLFSDKDSPNAASGGFNKEAHALRNKWLICLAKARNIKDEAEIYLQSFGKPDGAARKMLGLYTYDEVFAELAKGNVNLTEMQWKGREEDGKLDDKNGKTDSKPGSFFSFRLDTMRLFPKPIVDFWIDVRKEYYLDGREPYAIVMKKCKGLKLTIRGFERRFEKSPVMCNHHIIKISTIDDYVNNYQHSYSARQAFRVMKKNKIPINTERAVYGWLENNKIPFNVGQTERKKSFAFSKELVDGFIAFYKRQHMSIQPQRPDKTKRDYYRNMLPLFNRYLESLGLEVPSRAKKKESISRPQD